MRKSLGLISSFSVLTWVLYLISIHSFSGNSDGATVILEGQAMSAGDVLLHGWSFTLESFWSIDATIYAATIRLTGLHLDLIHLGPAIVAALLILLGARMATMNQRGTAAIVGASVTIAILALPSPDLAYFFLAGPLHVATALWCLIVFTALSNKSSAWGWGIAICFLAAGLLGDFMTVAIGIGAVLFTALITLLQRSSWRRGVGLLIVPAASIALALVLRMAARLPGTFTIVNREFPIDRSQLELNIRHIPSLLAKLLGVGSLPIDAVQQSEIFQIFHIFGLAAFAGGIVFAIVNVALSVLHPSRTEINGALGGEIDHLLLFGFFGALATFVVFAPNSSPSYARYLTPAIIFGAILAGRGLSAAFVSLNVQRWRQVTLGIVSAVAAVIGIGLVFQIAGTAPKQPVDQLVRFLGHRNLTMGVGDYWSASIVTTESAGSIVVRPITADALGRLSRYDRQSSSTWYAGQPFEFFAYNTVNHQLRVDKRSAIAQFGRPLHIYSVGTFRVLVWSQSLAFSPSLPPESIPLTFS